MKRIFSLLLCFVVLFSSVIITSAEITTDKGVMKGILPDMMVSELKASKSDVKSVVKNGTVMADTQKIGTGYDIVCTNGTYKASVVGDLNGDAKISSLDYLILKKYYIGNKTLTDLEKTAADVNQDGKINTIDYLLLKKHIIGTYTIGTKASYAKSVPVLLYHHILPDKDKNTAVWKNNNITIATSEFDRQMQIIKDAGYTVVTMEALVEFVQGKRTLPEKSVVLCFDDGYLSNTYYAAPILRKYNYKATVFAIMAPYIYSGYQPVYYRDELQHFSKADLQPNLDVLSIQCHTYNNHNHLPEQSYNYVYHDLMLSQNGVPTQFFAYPYGDYNATVKKAVIDAGFKAAFTTVARNVTVGDDLFELPRHTITSPMSDNDFRNTLTNGEK